MTSQHSSQLHRSARSRLKPVAALAIGSLIATTTAVLSFSAPASATSSVGGSITGAEILTRAAFWYNQGSSLVYNQNASAPDQAGRNYRTDCSGFVSMAWHADASYNTIDIADNRALTTPITKDQLQPGDVLDARDGTGSNIGTGHVALFESWTDSTHTAYNAYEFGSTPVQHDVIPYPYFAGDGRMFSPYRYNNLTETAPPPTISATTAGFVRDTGGQLAWHLTNSLSGSPSSDYNLYFGQTGDIPVTGDWNHDGKMSAGFVRDTGGQLAWHLTNSQTGSPTSDYNLYFGQTGDIPVVGDWNHDGTMTPGFVRDTGGQLSWHLTNSLSGSPSSDYTLYFGQTGDIPVVGDWNHDGTMSPGFVRNTGGQLAWHLTNSLSGSPSSDYSLYFGSTGDTPVTGDW